MGFVVAFVFIFCLIYLCVACHMWCTLCMCLYENKSLMTSVDHRKHLYHFTWLWLNCSIYMNSFYNAKVWLSGLSVEKHKLLRLHQIYRCFKYQNHKVEWVWKDMSLSKSQIFNFWVNCPFKMCLICTLLVILYLQQNHSLLCKATYKWGIPKNRSSSSSRGTIQYIKDQS